MTRILILLTLIASAAFADPELREVSCTSRSPVTQDISYGVKVECDVLA